MIRTLAAACLMSLATGAGATSADAKTIFETATFTGVDTGEYIVSDSRYFGVAFTLDKTTDLTEKVDVSLSAGTYGVVFGSGAFGADGNGGLGGNNNTVGSPNFFTYFQFDGDSWEAASLDGARITVSGVPEASTWALMLIGFGGLGFAGARASRSRAENVRKLSLRTR
jgi:hypothetical protein